MNAIDICIEAGQYNVVVSEGIGPAHGTTRFSRKGEVLAWCSRSLGRTWVCNNCNGAGYRAPSKAAAYSWCLDQAANGPV